jgi:hypothetical protein
MTFVGGTVWKKIWLLQPGYACARYYRWGSDADNNYAILFFGTNNKKKGSNHKYRKFFVKVVCECGGLMKWQLGDELDNRIVEYDGGLNLIDIAALDQ